ncbi:MAG: CBS domain-containing protein [Candidatus Peribacteraceae bacterium]|jgi:CBS domain-containing protein|nr:CBS domain-containing protein [Candidatus Peribacteraceae bacterium]|tara:strand:+ start:2527 stop:2880 length:354 start_codon:yes stop_codon:yes gene_type:complete
MDLSTFTILPTATLLEAAQAISGNTSRTVVVVEDYEVNNIIGILSEGDIMRALLKGSSVHTPVSEIMKVNFKYLEEGTDHSKAKEMFLEYGFGMIPVVSKDMHLQSVVTMLDCLRET